MASQGYVRKLAAVLAADVVGYTRLMAADEDATLAAWWAARKQIIDPQIAEHGGRIVKHTGDGFLAEFATATEAVGCAVAMQSALAVQNANVTKERRFDFRMGINIGEIIVDDEDIYGDGVNIAARIESIAEPGGIWVSGAVHEQVRKKLNLTFKDQGEQTLKNIPDPIRAYSVQWDGSDLAKPESLSHVKPDTKHLDKPSIAVLAFDNMSGDAEQEYFADGVTEDIITALSTVHSFFVVARNSSFMYKGRAVDIKTVGRELGVHYVLEGSVRKAGNRVRVTAQLIEAATANHVWADRYEGSSDDIFDLQDQITASVIGAIEPKILAAEVERIKHKRSAKPDAYDYTLRGLAQMNQLTPEDTAEARRLFLKAMEIDPGYARAYACASWCGRRWVMLRGMVLEEDERVESVRLANLALKIDPTDPYILWQAGLTFALLESDLDRAIELIERSLSINSNSTRGWLASSMIHNAMGQPELAIEEAERAIRLSPLETAMWVAHGQLATAYMQLGDYQKAALWANRAVEKHADNLPAHHVLAASLANLGKTDEARDCIDRLLRIDGEMTLSRLRKIFPVSRYRNLEGMLDGLRKAGLAE